MRGFDCKSISKKTFALDYAVQTLRTGSHRRVLHAHWIPVFVEKSRSSWDGARQPDRDAWVATRSGAVRASLWLDAAVGPK
jgi:hypothetical protein